MKLLVLSDLHVEFAPFVPDRGAVAAANAVVLAGDIACGTKAIAWARQAFGDESIVYVTGNHEFYRFDWTKLLDQLRCAGIFARCVFFGKRGDHPGRRALPGRDALDGLRAVWPS